MTPIPLVVTADDYGLTDATSRCILDAHRHGVVTATSVLAVVPGLAPRLRWLLDEADLSVGVHLALVGEDPPVLAASEIPTLVDDRGRFRRSWRHLVAALAAGRVASEDVRAEMEAQIAIVAGAVGRPTHLDTHQHVHLWPSIGATVIDLARRHGIGAVRVPDASRRTPRGRAIGALARRLASAVDGAGLARTDRFRGLDEAGGWTAATLATALGELAAQGTGSVEINLHPGTDDDPDRHRYRWGYGWGAERAAALAPELRATIERHGFELVGR